MGLNRDKIKGERKTFALMRPAGHLNSAQNNDLIDRFD